MRLTLRHSDRCSAAKPMLTERHTGNYGLARHRGIHLVAQVGSDREKRCLGTCVHLRMRGRLTVERFGKAEYA